MSDAGLPEIATAENLTKVLRDAELVRRGRVRAVSIESSRTLILSKIIRLRLEYEDGESGSPRFLFLKTGLPQRTGGSWNPGRTEVAFYTSVAPHVPTGALPRCFDAHWEPSTETWHLLLEDLSETHAIATVWPIPPTFDQCKRLVEAWAGFHGFWWDDPRLGKEVGTWYDAETRAQNRQGFVGQFAEFADRIGDRLSLERRELYERIFAAPQFWARYDSHRNMTLVQGDAHFWNCFLPKDGGDDARLFDWDGWRLGIATDDLAYMIAMHWYPERRQRFESSLLDFYHDAIVRRGVKGYDRRALNDDYRLSVLGLVMMPIWQALNDIPRVIWWNNLERIFLAVDDLNCRELLS